MSQNQLRLTMERDPATNKYDSGVCGMNKINELPDAVLCSIISLLAFHEAVATSVLSRRWGNLWHCVSRIRYHPKPHAHNIGHVINSLSNKEIHICEIEHLLQDHENGVLESWIEFIAARKGTLKELSLGSNHVTINIVPRGLFHGENLTRVKLRNYMLLDACPFEGCVNLRAVKLESVYARVQTLIEILCYCSRLEKLVLKKYDYRRKLSLSKTQKHMRHASNLRTLKLHDVDIQSYDLEWILGNCSTLEKLVLKNCIIPRLNIRHDKLKTLKIWDLSVLELYTQGEFSNAKSCMKKLPIIRCPCIEELSLRGPYQTRQGFERSTGMIGGTENAYDDNIIKDLRILSTMLDLNKLKDHILLAYGFQVWPNLEKLDITNVQTDLESAESELPYPENELWERRALYDSLSSKLKTVTIRRFSGTEREIMFVSHLIRHATKLKQLVIECDDTCSREGAAKTLSLLSEPRACSDICIMLKPGKISIIQKGDNFDKWMSTLPETNRG